jgi:hypothetical protein
MPSSWSSQPSFDMVSSTTTIAQAVDVYNAIEKKRYQAPLLLRHHMWLRKEYFSLLIDSNLMDELVKLLEDVDRSRKMQNNANRVQTGLPKDTDESEKNGICEVAEEEETDDDEDEDYFFNLEDEDEDDIEEEDNDINEENEHKEPSTVNKLFESKNVILIDASTQIKHESDDSFSGSQASEQQTIKPSEVISPNLLINSNNIISKSLNYI